MLYRPTNGSVLWYPCIFAVNALRRINLLRRTSLQLSYCMLCLVVMISRANCKRQCLLAYELSSTAHFEAPIRHEQPALKGAIACSRQANPTAATVRLFVNHSMSLFVLQQHQTSAEVAWSLLNSPFPLIRLSLNARFTSATVTELTFQVSTSAYFKQFYPLSREHAASYQFSW